jgi:D-sedoheptulose 7-phosphate isomerase
MTPTERLEASAAGIVRAQAMVKGVQATIDEAVEAAVEALEQLREFTNICWLFGNGGSGTIADHIATDMCLRGWRALALTNPAATTSMANDLGFERAYSGQLQRLASGGDVLVGMSCSGESRNIMMAMAIAPQPCFKITLSGFARENMMSNSRVAADVDFWVPSSSYGVVQIAHLAILHAIVDHGAAT